MNIGKRGRAARKSEEDKREVEGWTHRHKLSRQTEIRQIMIADTDRHL